MTDERFRPCGTRSSYIAGCHCDACTAANTSYITAWRHRTGRTDPARWEQPGHGIGGYRRGCRCDDCRAANTRNARRYRARRLGTA